jgi:ligand-binding sensor domain-containing protein
VLTLTAVLAAAGGYFAGRQPATVAAPVKVAAQDPAPPQVPAAAKEPAPAPAPAEPLRRADASTPAVAAAHAEAPPAEPAAPPREGIAHAAGTAGEASYTHFRVGDRNVKAILADGDLLWVGTSGGVVRYDLKSEEYRLFDLRSGLLANGIFHVGKIGERLVVGTYGGGMALFDAAKESWQIFNIPDGLGDPFVYDVLAAANGDVWIATWSGVNRVRGGALTDRSKWDLYTVKNTDGGLPNDWVYALTTDPRGTIWLATEGGLAHFVDGKWTHWRHEDGLGADYELVKDQIQFKNDPAQYSSHHARQKSEMGLKNVDVAYNPNYIVALTVDRDGIVWCGTWGGGLARFDGTHWKNYTVADGLPGNHVFMLHEDTAGRLWIGTSNGLALKTADGFKVFTTKDGLFANTVFSMATSADGSAWVGSFGGVARIKNLR